MIDATLAAAVVAEISGLASETEAWIIGQIAARVVTSAGRPGATTVWAANQLASLTRFRSMVDRHLGGWMAATDPLILAGLNRATMSAETSALAELRSHITRPLVSSTVGARSGPLIVIAEELSGVVASTRQGVLRATLDMYRRTVASVSAATVVGAVERRTAAQEAITRLAGAGIGGFVDRAGRSWQLASYVEMATRTTVQRAMTEAHTQALSRNGHDLVIVSDAPHECHRCRPWEQKILSISDGGAHDLVLPSLATGEPVTVHVTGSLREAKAAGLYHPNCRHSHSAYLPGVTKPKTRTADPKGQAARERQRLLERRVRAAKLAEAAAVTEAAKTQARARVREAQKQVREHVDANDGLFRRPERERVGAGAAR